MADSHPQSYPQAFNDAVALVLQVEGGYVKPGADPGGETNFGISRKSYPQVDIAHLTRDQAIAIYFSDFWDKFHLDELIPWPRIAAKIFSVGVNIYMPPAIVCLQRACRACGWPVDESGVLDGATHNAVQSFAVTNENALLAALRSELAAHYRLVAANKGRAGDLFLKGWLRRAYA